MQPVLAGGVGLFTSLALMRYGVYPVLRMRAWRVVVVNDSRDHPRTVAPGWSLAGRAPGYDARGVYQLASHLPIFLAKIIYASVLFWPRFLEYLIRGHHADYISDMDLFDMCTRCSLVVLGRFLPGDQYEFRMDPERSPTFGEVGGVDPQSLYILWRHGELVKASSKNGPVEGARRNQLLAACLRNIVAVWVHPASHVVAERCALEIQARREERLSPSAHFVSSLHEGLLHHTNVGPLGPNSPFLTEAALPKLVEDAYDFPVPHIIEAAKEQLEIYHFLMRGRAEIARLVRKHELHVDTESLFVNLVMHLVDHEGLFEVMSRMPLFSSDGSGSWYSLWRMHCFIHIWLGHWNNPLNSELVADHRDMPIYRELHESLSKVNRSWADRLVLTTSF